MGASALRKNEPLVEFSSPDQFAPEGRARLTRTPELMGRIRELSVLASWRTVVEFFLQWASIAGAVAVALHYSHWAVYGLAMVFIATRQHALVLLMHEGAHLRIFNHRGANDLVSNLFAAFPIGLVTGLYRTFHFEHHRLTGTEGDPEVKEMRGDDDWSWPKTRAGMFRVLLKDALGLNLHKTMAVLNLWSPYPRLFKRAEPGFGLSEKLLFVAFAAVLVTCLTLLHGWPMFLLLWQVPLMTFFGAVFRVRALGEHAGLKRDSELTSTGTTEASWLEGLFITPMSANYHLEHHLFPSLPFYRLAEAHRLLKDNPEFKGKAAVYSGYFSLKKGVLGAVSKTGPESVPDFKRRP